SALTDAPFVRWDSSPHTGVAQVHPESNPRAIGHETRLIGANAQHMLNCRGKRHSVEEICCAKYVIGPRGKVIGHVNRDNILSEILSRKHSEPLGLRRAQGSTQSRSDPAKSSAVRAA